jgi:threonine/homoserine/homoserine lactone efflux protein
MTGSSDLRFLFRVVVGLEALYALARRAIDRVTGEVFVLLGARLALQSR